MIYLLMVTWFICCLHGLINNGYMVYLLMTTWFIIWFIRLWLMVLWFITNGFIFI